MEAVNQEHSFNESFFWHQKSILDSQHKTNNPLLAPIEYTNNYLSYLNESFPLGIFRLSNLPANIYNSPVTANEYFNLVKFFAYIENLIHNYPNYITDLKEILEKIVLSDFEIKAIDDFVNNYNFMTANQKYLYGNSAGIWKEYQNIVATIAHLANQNYFLTEAQIIINEKIIKKDNNLESANSGRGNAHTRVLTNPAFPNMAPDDDGFSKAGFASILLIIYSLINAAVILAIQFLK